jgi:uncharacterized protein YjiK
VIAPLAAALMAAAASPALELPPAERIAVSGAREPSGVAYHAGLRHLFVVGDEGSLVELDDNGRTIHTTAVAGDLEDVLALPSGALMLLSERSSELILYDPVKGREKTRWTLDQPGLLGRRPQGKNNGFEGLAFREVAGKPGGGIVYLVHQGAPAMIVGVAFDPETTAGTLGDEVVISRFALEKRRRVAAATFAPTANRLFVIADGRLLVMGMDGVVESELPLPGTQQEGLCFDAAGNLWVADDRGGALLRFPAALSRLQPPARQPAAAR